MPTHSLKFFPMAVSHLGTPWKNRWRAMLKIMFGYRDKRENISHYLGNPLYPMPTILLSSLTIHAPTWTEILDSWAFNQGWAFCIAIYRESNILHHLKTSENIAIPEVITIFLRYFFVHDISHFWSFMDQLTNAIHQFSCVFTCVSLIGSSLLLYLICHIFVMNWHHTLHFKSATFFAKKYKIGHFCHKNTKYGIFVAKIST